MALFQTYQTGNVFVEHNFVLLNCLEEKTLFENEMASSFTQMANILAIYLYFNFRKRKARWVINF